MWGLKGNSNIPLEHTPDPQLAVYEGNPVNICILVYLGYVLFRVSWWNFGYPWAPWNGTTLVIKAQGVTMATRFLCTVEAEKLYESTGLGFVNLGRNLSEDLFFWGGIQGPKPNMNRWLFNNHPKNFEAFGSLYVYIYIYKVMASTTEWTTMSSIICGMHDDAMSFPWPLPNLCQAPIDHKIKVGSEFGLNFSPCPPGNSDFCSSK